MKTTFTKLFAIALLTALTLTGFAVQAQTSTDASTTSTNTVDKTGTNSNTSTKKEEKASTKTADADTAWKPLRRLWGYTFGDFYYDAHADQTTGARGAETNYNGVPTYRNAFQFRRIYLGYDYDINKNFRAELLLASEPSANTTVNGTTSIQNGDNLVDNKMSFFIKNINLRWMNVFNGTDFVIGEMSTPGFALNEAGTNGATSLSETTWGYRFIEKTVSDFHKTNSYDVGASLQGTFDPATKNFGYVVMVGNNSQASLLAANAANTGFYKIFYGDLWAKVFNKKLVFDIYADYVKTAPATFAIGPQSHNMIKGFVAYTTPKLSIGVEAYSQQISQGVTNTISKLPEDATVQSISIWVKGAIVKDKLNFFARYDSYNPDNTFNNADSYTANTNFSSYNPTVKEQFYTAGLDFTPTKNVHFSPNLWLIDYKDQRDPATTGYVAPDHNLVYRLTFYYVFGK
jgi:hypothetical protein